MPAPWITIPDADLDEGDPIYEKTIKNLRDNVLAIIEGHASAPRIGNGVAATVSTIIHSIDGAAFQDGTISGAKLPSSLLIEEDFKGGLFGDPVHRNEVKKTSQVQTHSHSVADPGFNFTLTNGVWLLGYETRLITAGATYQHKIGVGYDGNEAVHYSSTAATYAWMKVTNTVGGPWTLEHTHYYIQTSPPYDLGQGKCAGFIFASQNADGSISSASLCDDPPWVNALNYRAILKPDGRSYYRRRVGRQWQELEVTPQSKNYAKELVPHPWVSTLRPGQRALIIDPTSQLCDDLMILRREGVDVLSLIHSGDIELKRELAGLGTPSAVTPIDARWR